MSALVTVLLAVAGFTVSPFDPALVPAARFHPYISVATGLQYNVRTRLVISQNGSPDIKLVARYDTKPFTEVPYYDIKLGVRRRAWAYELELIHHKLYLVNRPPEVDTFEITHGYNPILLNLVREEWGVAFRAGAGILLAHPESTVRGLRFPETGGILGWYVSGPAAQLSVSKWLGLSHRFCAGFEGKLVGAWARVPIVDGSANVPNLSLHGLVSVCWRF
ncbi:MAG: hypothetical protein NTX53_09615 [candidate division WOR-3 bacterium]|nr:hypothetical protein [candidate division WOR-3 bacterium]